VDERVRVGVIVAAGGRGTRLHGDVPKPLRLIAGRTILERSIEPFDDVEQVQEIVVVLPPDLVSDPPAVLRRFRTPLKLVRGGVRRQDSVSAGLDALTLAIDVVVVHDAARPFCTADLIGRTVDAAAESGAAIAALPAHDTIKEGKLASAVTVVRSTLSRERIFLAQTPQAFRFDVLRQAVAAGRNGVEMTDEAALVEHAGHQVRLVEGEPRNMKITTEADLALARELAQNAPPEGSARVGLGYDLHRLVEGRTLVLGGVKISGDRGLLGHSDADAVCHAVIDAVLGAAAAGDIGRHFPDDDARWTGASSLDLLARAVRIVNDVGFVVGNIDVTIVAEWPKVRDHAEAMCRRLAGVLQVDAGQINIKGKTNEGVDTVGKGSAIAVHAIALLYPTP
jgi:2-C-methyl-D-erythritol 4-phosphate cytidylyltransferase/2-C-methyl-D-erythritol 2,4-cyclodiphosphate synthase